MEDRYIIQVAPLIPLPVLGTQVFSYWYNEALPVGTLVLAPFYFREIEGIVVKSRQNIPLSSSLKLKSIRSVKEKNFLGKNQIQLAQNIADYYFTPLGSVLKLMVPKVVKRGSKNKKISGKAEKNRKIGNIALKIIKSNKKKFLLMASADERENIAADLIQEYLKKNKQCLILVPEIFSAHGAYEKIRQKFSGEIALIHSRITKGQYYDSWEKIKDGKTKIVIATKQGIFLPFSKLGLIIIQDEQDISFKQWEAMPRYSAVRGAEFLADITCAKYILGSSLPSVESFHRAETNEMEMIEVKNDNKSISGFEVVPFEKERGNPDFPISKILYSRLAEIVKNKKQAVVFVNRRGFSTRTICENCKKVLKCPKCDRALIYSEESGQYRCLHCAHKMDLLSACPTCSGFQFSHRGIGTQTVEKKIKKLFPSARIVRLDADAMRSPSKYQNILLGISRGEVDILVGTQSAIKGIFSENIELASAVSGRDFADGIEYKSREIALSRLFSMSDLLKKKGVISIHSFFEGNPLFDIFSKQDLKKHYTQELTMRERFFYPPYRKFVKLAYRGKSEKKAENEAKKIFDLLRRTGNNGVEIVGPYEPFSKQKRGQYHRNILIKFAPEKNIRDLPIRAAIGGLRKGWSVDVDPVSIN